MTRKTSLILAAFVAIFCFNTTAASQTLKLPDAVWNAPYHQSIPEAIKSQWGKAFQGSSLEWRAVGRLPAGLALDASGALYGTATAYTRQAQTFRVAVVDRAAANGAPAMVDLLLKVLKEPETSRGGPVLRPIAAPPGTAGTSDDNNVRVEVGQFERAKSVTLPLIVRSGSPIPLEITVTGPDGVARSEWKDTLPPGDVYTSAKIKLQAGRNTVLISHVFTGARYKSLTIDVPESVSRGTNPDEGKDPGMEIKHDGFVSSDATTTKLTVHVTDAKVKKVRISVKPVSGEGSGSSYDIQTTTGTQDYVQTIALVNGDNKILAQNGDDEKAGSASLTIKRKDNSEKVKISGSKLIDRSALTTPLTVNIADPTIGKVKLLVIAKGQETEPTPNIFDEVVLECRTAQKDGCPTEVRVPDAKDAGVYLVDVTGIEDPAEIKYAYWKTENDKAATVTDKKATAVIKLLRRGNSQVANYSFSSLNTRAIVGFEQAGASSSESSSKPFLDFFFNAPLWLKPQDGLMSRASLWGNVRLAALPQQLSSFAVFPTTLVNQITESKLTDLVHGFDFMVGPEVRLATSGSVPSLIPGVKQRVSVYLAGGFGAISPLDAKQTDNVLIYKVPTDANSAQYAEFKDRFPEAVASGKKNVAFTFQERDRFLRQYYAGLRFKTHYENGSGIINRFPAIFDVMFGQNEAATGGRLRGAVMKMEGFFPLPIKEASFLYLYGTAMMKLGAGVKTRTPLFLEKPGSDVGVNSTDLFFISNRQGNTDYYRIGVGIDLMRLFNQKPKEN